MSSCPKCGSPPSILSGGNYFICDSNRVVGGGLNRSAACRDRQIAQLTAENARLKRKADAFDWMTLNCKMPLFNIHTDEWFFSGGELAAATALDLVEAAMKQEQSNDR